MFTFQFRNRCDEALEADLLNTLIDAECRAKTLRDSGYDPLACCEQSFRTLTTSSCVLGSASVTVVKHGDVKKSSSLALREA